MEIQATPDNGETGPDSQTTAEAGFPLELVTRGEGAEHARRRFQRALERVAARSPRRTVFVRASLTFEPHHSLDARAEAKAAFDVGGHVVHAHAEAATFAEAIDRVVDRLRHSLHELAERRSASRKGRPAEEPHLGEAGS